MHVARTRRLWQLACTDPDHLDESRRPIEVIVRADKLATTRISDLAPDPSQRRFANPGVPTEKQLSAVIAYVERNPARSGLAAWARGVAMVKCAQDTGGKTAGATSGLNEA